LKITLNISYVNPGYVVIVLQLFSPVSHVLFNQVDFVQETTLLLLTLGEYSRSCMVSKAYPNLLGLQNEILQNQTLLYLFSTSASVPKPEVQQK